MIYCGDTMSGEIDDDSGPEFEVIIEGTMAGKSQEQTSLEELEALLPDLGGCLLRIDVDNVRETYGILSGDRFNSSEKKEFVRLTLLSDKCILRTDSYYRRSPEASETFGKALDLMAEIVGGYEGSNPSGEYPIDLSGGRL